MDVEALTGSGETRRRDLQQGTPRRPGKRHATDKIWRRLQWISALTGPLELSDDVAGSSA